jgi:hypothetical protein
MLILRNVLGLVAYGFIVLPGTFAMIRESVFIPFRKKVDNEGVSWEQPMCCEFM